MPNMCFFDTNCYLNIVFNGNKHNILTKSHLIDDKILYFEFRIMAPLQN